MVVLCLLVPGVASAQSVGRPSGNASLTTDYEPNRHDTVELRGRLFAEEKIEIAPSLRVTASGFVEGLVASRPTAPDLVTGETRNTTVTDAVVRVHDAFAELTIGRLDLRAGFARVVWGRLDEIQPTDVVNPLDASRFFFEGRSEARAAGGVDSRQPVPLGIGRQSRRCTSRSSVAAASICSMSQRHPSARGAPRRGDCRLPGNRLPTLPPVIVDDEPSAGAESAQGGARFSATTGRIDWAVVAYGGREPSPSIRLGRVRRGRRATDSGYRPAVHHDWRRRRDRPWRVGHSHRGGGVRRRQLPGAVVVRP